MTKLHHNFHHTKASTFAFEFLLPTLVLALLLLVVLACNGFFVFCTNLLVPVKSSQKPVNLLLEIFSGDKTVMKLSSSSSLMMYTVKKETPPFVSKVHFYLLQKPNVSMAYRPKQS
ncbi:hypothetical protein V6N12_043066 [Hibiscus sabdariffa]|uniref:Transmembrane protein n=1 Tax=Hibiscus sabdariffa TaxID=183260 RepID=A0ABR2DJQ3_9ROSI